MRGKAVSAAGAGQVSALPMRKEPPGIKHRLRLPRLTRDDGPCVALGQEQDTIVCERLKSTGVPHSKSLPPALTALRASPTEVSTGIPSASAW